MLCFAPAFFLKIDRIDAFLVSTGIVALAEIGDKTQLLAFLLAAKFRRPVPIVLGILVATIVNHAFAAAVGAWVASAMGPNVMRWVLGLSFLAMAAWSMVSDKIDEDDAKLAPASAFSPRCERPASRQFAAPGDVDRYSAASANACLLFATWRRAPSIR